MLILAGDRSLYRRRHCGQRSFGGIAAGGQRNSFRIEEIRADVKIEERGNCRFAGRTLRH